MPKHVVPVEQRGRSASRLGSSPGSEAPSAGLEIRLGSVDDLFVAPPVDGLPGPSSRFRSGIEEILNELAPKRLRDVASATIVLPAEEIEPGLEERLQAAVARYCELRIRETDNDLRSLRREGLRALAVGLVVLAAGLAAAAYLQASTAPTAVRTYLADGLLTVLAWVGAWYPLDILIHYIQPYRRTKKVLEAASRLEIAVRPAA